MTRIGSIVEGYGEVEALPILLRRVFEKLNATAAVQVERPVRVPRGRLLKPGELERYIQLLAGSVGPSGGILLLLDADEDCPATLGPALLERIAVARSDRLVSVVLAKREFEAWFIASARSLAGSRGLPADLEPPRHPEEVNGAKEWLSERMRSRYTPTLDQPALAARLDIDLARSAPSFDKFVRECARHVERNAF